MSTVSIVIPARNERFLPQTVADIHAHATGDYEIIVILDGYWPDPILPDHPRLKLLHWSPARGMRACINAGAAIARGQYLMKVDAHCSFSPGFDEILSADCADNWIVIPRRLSLDAEAWQPTDKEPVDYEHIFWPYAHPDDLGLHARPWRARRWERLDILLDEDMSFQGSAWFMDRRHFERLGGMSEWGYETFLAEPQELGFKTQLGPWRGQVMRNKRCWYAHLHKGKQYGRMYSFSNSERQRGNSYSFDHWWHNRWTERVMDIEDLIERFMPIPGWPKNWREIKSEISQTQSIH